MHLLAGNVTRRAPTDGPTFQEHVDVLIGETLVRLAGVMDIANTAHSFREAEWIRQEFSIAPVAEQIRRVLRDTPVERPVVFLGHFAPADLPRDLDPGRPVLFLLGSRRFPRIAGDVRKRDQEHGRLGELPVVFDTTNGYGVQTVQWRPGAGPVFTEAEILRGSTSPDSPVSVRIREYLEGLGGDEPIELVFEDPLHDSGATYVGSDACLDCHENEYAQWRGTPHASAMSTLRRVQRQRVRNCVACHVVGFEKTSGYVMESASIELENVGCEVCHGPGGRHVDRPSRENIRRVPSEALCASCHTGKHSSFLNGQQASYFERVVHGG